MKTSARFKLSLAALLLAGSTAAFGAGRGDEIATQTVKVRDLDLATAAGAQELYSRIERAARNVCMASAPTNLMFECRARVVEATVKDVGNPLLSSVHRSTVERVEELVRR